MLAGPKTTSYNLYLKQGLDTSPKQLAIYEKNFNIRGIKQYWLKDYIGYGYICLVEAVLSHLCEVYDLDASEYSERMTMQKLLYNRELCEKSEQLYELRFVNWQMTKIRNRIAHAAFNKEKNISFAVDVADAKGHYNVIKKLLASKELIEISEIISQDELNHKKMFLVFSHKLTKVQQEDAYENRGIRFFILRQRG